MILNLMQNKTLMKSILKDNLLCSRSPFIIVLLRLCKGNTAMGVTGSCCWSGDAQCGCGFKLAKDIEAITNRRVQGMAYRSGFNVNRFGLLLPTTSVDYCSV